jgi:uncharacterized protein
MEWILGREPAASIVDGLLEDAEQSKVRLLMSAINVGEVYYFLRKHKGVTVAETWRSVSGTLPVVIEAPSSQDIWSAALLKGQFPLSYADAFAAALAQKHNCPVVTGDPEFRSVKNLKIEWVGTG